MTPRSRWRRIVRMKHDYRIESQAEIVRERRSKSTYGGDSEMSALETGIANFR